MIKSKYISVVVAVAVMLALIGSFAMMLGASGATAATPEYEKKLFNGETVDIAIETDAEDWQGLLDNAQAKEYIAADLVINGERFTTVGIRTKGNSSLNQVSGENRYSLQLNPNKYVKGQSFYGLDNMCLNNLMGDATYMKDYLSYDIMEYVGVPAPLRNYARVTVNGEDYGLFLLLERYDDSFLDRNFGASTGELYNVKMQMGERSEFAAGEWEPQRPDGQNAGGGNPPELPEGFGGALENEGGAPDVQDEESTMIQDQTRQGFDGMGGGMPGPGGFSSGGGSLVYTDDDPASYGSIFNNAVSGTVSDNDKKQVITAIQKLNEGENIEQYWDVDEILRYLAAHTFVVNLDSYVASMQQNYYLLERNGVLSVLPWDYGLAFGGLNSRDAASVVNFPIDTPVSGVSMEDRPLVSQLLAVDEYRQRYHEYLNDIVEGYINSGLFEAEMDRLDAQINADVAADATAFYTHEEYEASLPVLKELVLLRAASVAGQLNGTVPSTTEGQNANADELIDAGDINLSALGSMGGGIGGGFPGNAAFGGNAMPGGEGAGQENFGGQMPDINALMGIFEAAQNGTLTDDQKEQLAGMGITEEELAQFAQRLPGGNNAPGAQSSNGQPPQGMAEKGGGPPGNLAQRTNVVEALSMSDWILYGILFLLLLVTIVFVARYSRKKWMKTNSR